MDKIAWDHAWEVLASVIEKNVWLSVPIVVLGIVAWQSGDLLKELLSHRREMWKLRNGEQRRLENVEKRRSKRHQLAHKDQNKEGAA